MSTVHHVEYVMIETPPLASEDTWVPQDCSPPLEESTMQTQTHFYGPSEVTDYGDGTADVYRCEVTTEGITHRHVASLEWVGRQCQVLAPGAVTLGWIRRNAWQRWEALQAHGDTYVLVACKSTTVDAISAVLEGQR